MNAQQRNNAAYRELRLKLRKLEKEKAANHAAIKKISSQIGKLERSSPADTSGSEIVDETRIAAHAEDVKKRNLELSLANDSMVEVLPDIEEVCRKLLHHVNLASKYTPDDTNPCTTVVLAYPTHKSGDLIGPKGSTKTKIMERSRVHVMNIDGKRGKVKLTGTYYSVYRAIVHIRSITEAKTASLVVPQIKMKYLRKYYKNYTPQHVSITFPRGGGSELSLKGTAESISDAVDAFSALQVIQESRCLSGVDDTIFIGKNGSNIKKWILEYQVIITVTYDDEDYASATATADIAGPPSNVDAATLAIAHFLEQNEEVTRQIPIKKIVRAILLSDRGALVKKMRSDVRKRVNRQDGKIELVIDSVDDSREVDVMLNIYGRRCTVSVATDVVNAFLTKIMESIVKVPIDPWAAPYVSGAGSKIHLHEDTIASIFKQDEKVELWLYSHKEDVEYVIGQIEAFREERLDCTPPSFELVRRFVGGQREQFKNHLFSYHFDEENFQIVLHGNDEGQINVVSDSISAWMARNYSAELIYGPENENALLTVDATHMEENFGISVNLFRTVQTAVLRGDRDDVLTADKWLNQYLFGGGGRAVATMFLPKAIVDGELRTKALDLDKVCSNETGLVTLRGEEKLVSECRSQFLRKASSLEVEQWMEITEEDKFYPNQPDLVAKLDGIPVEVVLKDSKVHVHGTFANSRDALARLKFRCTGIYEAYIELGTVQYMKARLYLKEASGRSVFDDLEKATATEIELSPMHSSVAIRGESRGVVKKAKFKVMKFLMNSLLPSNFSLVKVAKAFQSTVANGPFLADVAIASGASVALDRDLNSIRIMSSDPKNVHEATELVNTKMTQAQKLVSLLQIDQNESWLLSRDVGIDRQSIDTMCKEMGCHVVYSTHELSITITSNSEDSVARAKASLEIAVTSARQYCKVVDLPRKSIPDFIGINKTNIDEFEITHQVVARRVGKTKILVEGTPDRMVAASSAIAEWVDKWEEMRDSLNGETSS